MTRNLLKVSFFFIIFALSSTIGIDSSARDVITPKDSVKVALSRVYRNTEALEKLLSLYRKNGDSTAVALTLAQIGKSYNLKSDYIRAINYYQEAAALQKGKNVRDYIATLTSLATNCRRIGAYSSASDYLFEALALSDARGNDESREALVQRTYILNGIGNVYKYLNDGVEAERYFRESLAIDEKIGNELGQSMNWNTIGAIYEYRAQYDSAKVMYFRALEHSRNTTSDNSAGVCYNRLGQLADIQGRYEEAEEYYLMAFDVLTRAHDKWDLAKTTCNLGRLYIIKGDYDLAKKYLDQSESLVAGNRSYGHLGDIHSNLATLYEKKGDFKRACEEMKLCHAYADSSFNQKSGQEVAQTRIRYEQDKSQKLLKEITIEKEQQESAKKRIMLISLIVLVCLLVLIINFGVLIRIQHKRNQELAEMNSLKNKFFSIISHDLKNPVTSQKKVLEMLVQNFDSLPQDVLKKQCQELYKSSATLLELLTGLLNWSRLNTGKIINNPIRLCIRNVVEDTVKPLAEQCILKNITLSNDVKPDICVFADRNILSIIIRNLVSNAVKFSREGGSIEITSAETGIDKVRISVIDHGVGISEDRVKDLFDINKKRSTAGTAGEIGSGLGLPTTKEMTELAGGSISVESEEGKGSTFSITLSKIECDKS